MNTQNSPFSIRMPKGWEKLTEYLEGGERPSSAEAEAILGEFLDHLPLALAMLTRTYHGRLRRSIQIPAEFYGYRGEGLSYHYGKGQPGYRLPDFGRRSDANDDGQGRETKLRSGRRQTVGGGQPGMRTAPGGRLACL